MAVGLRLTITFFNVYIYHKFSPFDRQSTVGCFDMRDVLRERLCNVVLEKVKIG